MGGCSAGNVYCNGAVVPAKSCSGGGVQHRGVELIQVIRCSLVLWKSWPCDPPLPPAAGKLQVLKTFNAVSPIVTGWTPLLAIDVWEVGLQNSLAGGLDCA